MARSSAVIRCSERRQQPRFTGDCIRASVRVRGRWGRREVSVVDFNRFGMSILSDRPIEAPRGLCISLQLGDLSLRELSGVIHNCRSTSSAGVDCFRLGVRFRLEARDQFDRVEVERLLESMEIRVESEPVTVMTPVT